MSDRPVGRAGQWDRQAGAVTGEAIARDLADLGVEPGQVLLVHSSLGSIGWVDGGALAVIAALDAVLGERGTLVMPAHSSQLGDPALRRDKRAGRGAIPVLRADLPAFDPSSTPTDGIGTIPESFRKLAGALRSNHPHDSFAARGPRAAAIVGRHDLHNGLGETSPLAALYELGAYVLLLGVGHESSTALHLAENRANYRGKRYVQNGANLVVGGERRWVAVEHLDYRVDDFNRIGRDYARETGEVRHGYIGHGQSMLMPIRSLVDYAVGWITRHR